MQGQKTNCREHGQQRGEHRRQRPGDQRAHLVAHRRGHPRLRLQQRVEHRALEGHVDEELVRLAVHRELPAGESIDGSAVQLQRARLLRLHFGQALDPAQGQRAAEVEVRLGQVFLQVERLLVLLDRALRLVLQEVHVAEIDVQRGEREIRDPLRQLQRPAVELLRLLEIPLALRLVGQGESDGHLRLLPPQPLAQAVQRGRRSFSLLEQPHVGSGPAEGRHPRQPFRRERRGPDQDQHGAGQRHLRRGGVERHREEQGEEERDESRLQQHRREDQRRGEQPGLPAACPGGDGADLGAGQDRRQPAGGRIRNRAVSAQALSDLRRVGAISVRGPRAVGMCGDLLRLDTQALVDRPEERTAHPRVDDEADRREHDRHPDGERERQAEADRKPAQAPPSLRRR